MDQQKSSKMKPIESVYIKLDDSDLGELDIDHRQSKQNSYSENFDMDSMVKKEQLMPEFEDSDLAENLSYSVPVRNSPENLPDSHKTGIRMKPIENKSVGTMEIENNEDMRNEIFTIENYVECSYKNCIMKIYKDHFEKHLQDHEVEGSNVGNKHCTRRFLCVECGSKYKVFKSIAMHIFDHFNYESSKLSKRNVYSHKDDKIVYVESSESETRMDPDLDDSVECIPDVYLDDSDEEYISHLEEKGSIQNHSISKIEKLNVTSVNLNQEFSAQNQSLNMSKKLDDNTVKCNECGKIFKDRKRNDMHLENYHNEMVCDCCERIFKGKVALKIHQYLIGKSSLTCRICGERFENDIDMINHIKLLHKEYKYENIESICDVCGKYVKSTSLKYHMKSHLSTEVHYCDQCDYQSYTRDNLSKHWRRQHSNAKPVKCNYCEKSFKNIDTRRSHIKDHHSSTSTDKPFICNICNKAFKRSVHLQRHQMLHSGEKPFGCTICDYRTNQRSNVTIHMKSHSK